jgi:methylenetetrahydrofolate dehydrogenase (NADP+)/methenyltetrahydrofolate cyclohydrolase
MPKLFDGKSIAENREKELKTKVDGLRSGGIVPTLASILVGEDEASKLYLELKKSSAERTGCSLNIINFSGQNQNLKKIVAKINELNLDSSVHGVMIQLPLPDIYTRIDRDQMIDAISPSKDVDSMRQDSEYEAPVVKSVMDAFLEASKISKPNYTVVVGSNGFSGRKIMSKLAAGGINAEGLDVGSGKLMAKLSEADAIISATGHSDLVKVGMVKEGVILIDVGAPQGDIDKAAYDKASFVSPVPGGIGPLTVVHLISNLVESAGGL